MLYIYDLVRSKKKPIETIKIDDELSTKYQYREASSINFNPRQRDFVAVGYYDKVVRIYKLSRNLSNMTGEDHKVLKEYLDEKKMD